MKKRRKKVLIALLSTVFLLVTISAVIFIKIYDFSLRATDFTLENSDGAICIKWTPDEKAEGYYIYRENDGERRKIAEVGNVGFYNDENVSNSKEYTYSAVAFSTSGRSFNKKEVSLVYIDIPSIVSCNNSVEGIKLYWTKVENAEGYNVYRKTEENGEWQTVAQLNSDAAEYSDNSMPLAASYYYTVSASIGGSESARDDGIRVDFIAIPQNVKATNIIGGIEISWDRVGSVEGYEVYRRSSESDPWVEIAEIGDCKTTQFIDHNVSNGTLYEYKINTYSGTFKSDYNSESVKMIYISPTAVNSVDLKENGFDIQWAAGSNIDGYLVFRKAEKEEYWMPIAVIDNPQKCSYTDNAVESGKKYSYAVTQNIGEYASAYVKEEQNKLFIATPELKVKNSPSGVKLIWTKSEGANEYWIYRKTAGEENWETIEKITGDESVSYIDKEVTYGKKIRYRIKAWADEDNQSLMRKSVSLYTVDPHKPMVALTYDDGPYAPATNSIVKTLKKNNGRATFFIVGSRIEEFEDCIKRADKIGCEIANHTYEHTKLTEAKRKIVQSEVTKTNKAVEAVIGKSPTLVRAPGGAVDDKVKKYVEYPLVNWSVDTLDWKYRNADSVISKVKDQVEDGSIVLMHDLYMSTAEASKTIVPWLKKQGYQLVTVTEMMDAKGIALKKGNLYTSAD